MVERKGDVNPYLFKHIKLNIRYEPQNGYRIFEPFQDIVLCLGYQH